MNFSGGLNFLSPIVAARWRSDFLAEIVGRAAGSVLPGFFSPIQVHALSSHAGSLLPLFTCVLKARIRYLVRYVLLLVVVTPAPASTLYVPA